MAQSLDQATELIAQLRTGMPEAMTSRKQWLVWRYEQEPDETKPRKVPYYVMGGKRKGKQGDERDLARLATFDAALGRLQRGDMTGVGFAFVPGDGLIGIDVDAAVDPDTGEISERCRAIVEAVPSYTELSPSGTGIHIIVTGDPSTFKSNDIGVEVYAGRQFFTCTGRRWPGAPATVEAISSEALDRLKAMVQAARAARAGARPAAPVPSMQGAPEDLRAKLEEALRFIAADLAHDDWVAVGMGIKAGLGEAGFGLWDYWSSKGSKYPGSEQLRRKWTSFNGTGYTEATVFKFAMEGGWKPPRRLRVVGGRAAEPDMRPEPPPVDDAGAPAPQQGGRGRRGRAKEPSDNTALKRLFDHFALIYGTDTVWDGETRKIVKVANVRLAFGQEAVKWWLNSPDRRMVQPEQVVFEPGADLPEGHINLFDGLGMEPLPARAEDVQPMLELLWHLCANSAASDEGVQAIVDWVLRWVAIQVQRPGTKLKTALVFHGPQGTGKNAFFDAVRKMFGKYGAMVGQNEIEDKFNDWLSAKLFFVANEVVTRAELYHNKNKLKWIITDEQIPIRAMHQSVRWESNHANLVFLSNEHQPVAIEIGDRRHLVVYTPLKRDDDLYARVRHFCDHDDGVRKFMGYLLTVDLGDFNPHDNAPMTEAKQTLIDLGMRPAERFMKEWLEGFLPLPVRPCSAEQLFRAFQRWAEKNVERAPPAGQFTTVARRYVEENVERDPVTGVRLEPRLTYKVVNLKDPVGDRRAVRCWLPRGTGPKDDRSEGEWVWECVEEFEPIVNRFMRSHAQHDDGGAP